MPPFDMIMILTLYAVAYRFVPLFYLWTMKQRSIPHIVEGLMVVLKEVKRKKRGKKKRIRRAPFGMLYYMDYTVSGSGDSDGGDGGGG